MILLANSDFRRLSEMIEIILTVDGHEDGKGGQPVLMMRQVES